MKCVRLMLLGGLGTLVFVACASAELVDLGSYGETVNVRAYIERLHNSRDNTRAAAALVQKAGRFPILSPGIGPGIVNATEVDLPQLHSPICVVGFDTLSEKWITMNHQVLVDTQSSCIVTNVQSEREVDRVKQWLSPVPAFAAPVNELFEALGQTLYPVLVSRSRVEQ